VTACAAVQAERTKAVLPFLKRAPRVILLSGTPALSRPSELFPQLQGLLPTAKLTKTEFADRYCVGDKYDDMTGCQNQDELNLVLVRFGRSAA
jgi:SWI/SNF-related matrix-associated actin-dependent regulator of chromatin subfamily A-like protein 1